MVLHCLKVYLIVPVGTDFRSTSDEVVNREGGAPVSGTDEVTKNVHDMLFELVDSAVTNFSGQFSSTSDDQASVCMYDHGLGALNGKPLKEVDPSEPFIEIRKNGEEACTSGDTCSAPDQLNYSGADSGFCRRFGYAEEAWNPSSNANGPCSLSPEAASSSPSSKVMQDQWPRYFLSGCITTFCSFLIPTLIL